MCIFCKIINHEIPSSIVYEDDLSIAILDISQQTKGHTLIIPKKHVENIFELDEELSKHLFSVTVKVTKLLKEKLHFENVNILNNNGSLAGQSVNHFHIHIIPQYENDNLVFGFKDKEPDFNKLNETLLEIKNQ